MKLRECPCRVPHPGNPTENRPHASDYCTACHRYINPEWSSGDGTVREFFDQLAAALQDAPEVRNPNKNPAWQQFRLHCEARELAGRPRFGQSFHGRDNIWEACEEAADLALYSMLDVLVARRNGASHPDPSLALTAAMYAFKSYEALLEMKAKRSGAP